MDYENNLNTAVDSQDLGEVPDDIYSHDYSSFYPSVATDNYQPGWGLDHVGVTQTSHPPTLYDDWRQVAAAGGQLQTDASRYASRSPVNSQAYPYHNYSVHQQLPTGPAYDPSMMTATFAVNDPTARDDRHTALATALTSTIAPVALDSVSNPRATSPIKTSQTQVSPSYKALLPAVPASKESGRFSIIELDSLSRLTDSKRMCAFVNIGQQDYEFPINKAVLPPAPVRRSRKELRRLAANDTKLLAKLGKSSRKSEKRSTGLSTQKSTSQARTTPRPLSTPAGIKYESLVSSDDSSSEYDSSDDDSDDEPRLPNPLPAVRPDDDAKGAVRYDTLKALWRSRRSALPAEEVRLGLKDYWEVVRTIRDRWKADTAALKEAEEKSRTGELPLLKSRVRDQREMMGTSIKAALEHGHKSIVEVLSENTPFLFLCYQFLLDRSTQDDVNGPLARSILGVLALCDTLTDEKLTKTHLVKLIPRYLKKGDGEVQTLVKKIVALASEGTRKTTQQARVDKADGAPARPVTARTGSVSKEVINGSKRPAPSLTSLPAKRVAGAEPIDKNSTSLSAKSAVPLAKKGLSPSTATRPALTSVSVTKTKAVPAKPSTFFNVMQSTNKKPVPATRPAISSVGIASNKPAEQKAPVSAVPAASSSVGFSFADTIAGLTKPKEVTVIPKQQHATRTETAEQRTRRVRKEARRGLRVTWRPDDDLTEIKFFTHDPDEELGHDASMVRDVADVGGEGRMFKQHKDMMDVDEEDDDAGEEDLKPFTSPRAINFDDVDPEERQRNFGRFGGGQRSVESPEKSLREQYESNTLMVIYTHPQEIPPSPKEPTEPLGQAITPAKTFGEPQAITLERSENMKSAGRAAIQAAPTTQTSDLAALLASLTPQSTAPPVAAITVPPSQPVQAQSDWQKILAQMSGPQSGVQAPTPLLPPAPANPAMAALFANMTGGFPPAQPLPPTIQPGQPDFASLLASLQRNQANGGTLAPPPPPPFGAGFPGFSVPLPPSGQYRHQ